MRISCLDSHVVRGCWAHSKFYTYYFILISDWVKEPRLSLSMSNYLKERSGLKTVMDLDFTLRNCQIGIREQLETYNANHKRMNVQNASQRQTKKCGQCDDNLPTRLHLSSMDTKVHDGQHYNSCHQHVREC